jgi:hypothetical protein
MGPRTGLDDVEKRNFLTLPGLELRPPYASCPPTRSQSVYRLRKRQAIIDPITLKILIYFPNGEFSRKALRKFVDGSHVALQKVREFRAAVDVLCGGLYKHTRAAHVLPLHR